MADKFGITLSPQDLNCIKFSFEDYHQMFFYSSKSIRLLVMSKKRF